MVTAFASIELAVDAMRLGATDFLRKPMTPETLRGAVAAAVRGKPSRATTDGRRPRPRPFDIASLTLNGFQILRSHEARRRSSGEHVFRVKHFPDGAEFTVTVAIDPEAVARVARLTHAVSNPGARSGACRPSGCCRRTCGAKARARTTAA